MLCTNKVAFFSVATTIRYLFCLKIFLCFYFATTYIYYYKDRLSSTRIVTRMIHHMYFTIAKALKRIAQILRYSSSFPRRVCGDVCIFISATNTCFLPLRILEEREREREREDGILFEPPATFLVASLSKSEGGKSCLENRPNRWRLEENST